MCGCINAHMHTHKTKYSVIIHTHIGTQKQDLVIITDGCNQ